MLVCWLQQCSRPRAVVKPLWQQFSPAKMRTKTYFRLHYQIINVNWTGIEEKTSLIAPGGEYDLIISSIIVVYIFCLVTASWTRKGVYKSVQLELMHTSTSICPLNSNINASKCNKMLNTYASFQKDYQQARLKPGEKETRTENENLRPNYDK